MSNHEVVVYIHGISPNENLATFKVSNDGNLEFNHKKQQVSEISHKSEYEALRAGVEKYLKEDKYHLWDKAKHCLSEWGWEYKESDAQNIGASHRLKDAQHQLGQRVIQSIKDSYWISLLPIGIRKLSLYGLSDAFYYISSDGRESVSARIYQQVYEQLSAVLSAKEDTVSLTLIGHSAGSVIAFDLLNYLFNEDDVYLEVLKEKASAIEDRISKLKEYRVKNHKPYTKREASENDTLDVIKSQISLKTMKTEGRIKLRRLITMGSPIAMMILRSDENIRGLAYGNRLTPTSLGLPESESIDGGPIWVNIWNKHDPISFPVEPIVEESALVKDFQLRVSWDPRKSHTNYWHSKNVHKLLASIW